MSGSKFIRRTSLIFFILGCFSLLPHQVSGQSPGLHNLETRVQEILDETGTPGAGVVLVQNGELLWAGGVGLADRETSRPVSGETIYRLGSISKTFVGLAVMRLYQEGQLDLEDPVRGLAPEIEFRNPWESTDPVRLIHLIEHTAGIDDLGFSELSQDGRTISQSGPRKVHWKPGTFFSYSSVGPNIAAYIVEKVTGQSFEEYVRTHFFDPLRMGSSGFSPDPERRPRLARGYEPDGSTATPFQPVPFRPSGSLYSTPNDFARFLEFMLNRGSAGDRRLLEEISVEQMESPASPLSARTGLMVGYGLGINTSVQEGLIVHGHIGGIGSYRARYAYSPGDQIGYAVMLNSPRSDVLQRVSNEVFRFLTRDLAPPVPPAPADVPLSRLRALTGYYVSATQSRELLRFYDNLVDVVRIEVSKDRVVADPVRREPERLIPVTDRRFRGENEPLPTAVFVEDGEDLLILSYSTALRGNYRSRSLWMVWSLWIVAASCVVLVLSSLVHAMIWLPRFWLGGISAQEPVRIRVWPLIASLLLVIAGVIIWTLPPNYIQVLGHFSFRSASLYLLSWLFPIVSLLAVIQCLTVMMRPKNESVWWHSLAVSVACLVIAGYLAYFGMIGVKTW